MKPFRDVHDFQLTDDEAAALSKEDLPKRARRLLGQDQAAVRTTTEAYRKLAAQWRAKAAFHEAYNAALNAETETARLEGESVSVVELRRQLQEAKTLAAQAIDGEQRKQRELERAIAAPAVAVHAAGTGL